MDTNQLKYFMETVETESFTKAAEKCFISQQALSKSINRLEEEFNIQLFERENGKKLKITSAGKLFLSHALRIMNELSDFKDEIRHENETQIIRFGSSLSSSYRTLARSFYKEHSNFDIETKSFREVVLYDKLLDNTIDVALSSYKLPSDAVVSTLIGKEHFYLAVPSTHRLANKSDVSVADLDNETLIQFGMFNSSFIDTFAALAEKLKINIKIINEDDFLIYQDLRKNFKYLYTTTRDAANELFSNVNGKILPFTDPELNSSVYLSYMKDNKKLTTFIQWFEKQPKGQTF